MLNMLFKTRKRIRILSRVDVLHFESLLRPTSYAIFPDVRLLGHSLLHGGLERDCRFCSALIRALFYARNHISRISANCASPILTP